MNKISTLQKKKAFTIATMIVVHIVLIFCVFEKQITNPFDSVLNAQYDGEKNNFTYLSYVKEEIGPEGIFKYNTFNYPYGEYVYSTDNTPLIAIPLRWFCHNVYDVSAYAMPIYNYFIISNILICGLLCFNIFRRLSGNDELSWLAAIFLPWTNIQVLRFFCGHYNLSLSSLLMVMILICIIWTESQAMKRSIGLLIVSALFIYGCFFIHGYYFPILLAFFSTFFLFFGIRRFNSQVGKFSILSALLLPLICGAGVYFTMIHTDGFFDLRGTTAGGYDWWELKANFSLFYTHYTYHNFFFPVWIEKNVSNNEAQVYLGNIGLYMTLLILIMALVNRNLRIAIADIQKSYFKNPLLGTFLGSGFILLSISLGEHIYIVDEPTRVTLPFGFNGSTLEYWFMILAGLLLCFFFIQSLIARKDVSSVISSSIVIKYPWLFHLCSAVIIFFMVGRYTNLLTSYHNITNPLFWMHQVTDIVEQFRALSRFVWPFYWVFYVWVFYTTAKLFAIINKPARRAILVLIILCGTTEIMDTVRTMKPGLSWGNIAGVSSMKALDEIKLDYSRYQAILPFPYYHVGSEKGNFTIDDVDEWSRYTYRLALKSGLPLMSNKVSRTPPAFAASLLNMIITGTASADIKKRLNEKPVLVMVARTIDSERILRIIPQVDSVTRPVAFQALNAGMTFAHKNSLPLVDSTNEAYFYEWRVK